MSTRRDFIKTVLLASGAVLTSWDDVRASAPHHPTLSVGSLRSGIAHEFLRDRTRGAMFPRPTEEVEVVIVGAGVSGLAAAWRLKKEKRSFLVLDMEPVSGGAARSGTWRQRQYPVGSGYFVTWDGVYKELYEDIKMPKITTGEDGLWYGPNELYVDFWKDEVIARLPITPTDKEAFQRFRDDLLKFKGLPEYPLSGANPANIEQWDTIPTSKYLSQYNSEELIRWMDQYLLSSCGSTVDEINAYCFLNFYSSEFGGSFDLPRYTSAGGITGLAGRMRDHVGAKKVRKTAMVVNVENVGNGVEVRYVDEHDEVRAVKAKSAIMAVQKRIAHNIVVGMPQEQIDSCKLVRYAPYVTVNLLCSGPLFPERGFDFWLWEKEAIFTDLVDAYYAEDLAVGKGSRMKGDFAYCVYCPHPEKDRQKLLDNAYLAEFAQRVADNVGRRIPGSRDLIKEMHVFAWGHTMVISGVNSHTTHFPLTSRPVGRIYFANTDNDLSPSVESGIANGLSAAEAGMSG
jgi:monoamine oxidase